MGKKKYPELNHSRKSWLLRLQDKWELNSVRQVVIVLIVFGLTGTTIALTKVYFMSVFGLGDTNILIKIIIGIFAYQVLILIFGTLFGQFNFFWKKEKKLFLAVVKLFKWLFYLPVRIFKTSDSDN